MSVKVYKYNKKQRAVLNAIKNYKPYSKSILTESFANDRFIRINKPLSEVARPSKRTKDMVCVSTKKPKIILFESSAFNTETLDSAEVIERVFDVCELTPENLEYKIHYPEQTIADYIVFFLPMSLGKDVVDKKYEKMNKIMTACGYFLSIEPEITDNGYGKEYTIQYEPNTPDCTKVFLPEDLHHLTTVANSEMIKKEGFIPKTNDIYNYPERIYFIETPDERTVMHLIRRHRDKLLKPGTQKTLQYADITIDIPKHVRFYYDYHMRDVNSFFCFEPVDSKYIKNIEIKEVTSLMGWLMPGRQ